MNFWIIFANNLFLANITREFGRTKTKQKKNNKGKFPFEALFKFPCEALFVWNICVNVNNSVFSTRSARQRTVRKLQKAKFLKNVIIKFYHFQLLKLLNFNFNTDLDPPFQSYADPDPVFHWFDDPDPAFQCNDDPDPVWIRIRTVFFNNCL